MIPVGRPCPSCEGDHTTFETGTSKWCYLPGHGRGTCQCNCEHPAEYHTGTRTRDGNYKVMARCVECQKTLHGVKKIHGRYEDIALERDHLITDPNPVCVRCGAPDTQLHHWAPRHLFGFEDADTWPTSYLCRACHALWHSTVTPRMGATGRRTT